MMFEFFFTQFVKFLDNHQITFFIFMGDVHVYVYGQRVETKLGSRDLCLVEVV